MLESTPPNVVIHIGMPKTGSSAIQRNFEGYDNDVAVYPDMRSAKSHTDVLIQQFASKSDEFFSDRKKKKGFLRRAPTVQESRHDLKRAIRNAGDRKVILSSETLPSRLSQRDLERLKRWMKKQGRDVRIVGYLRPPVAYASSNLHQGLRSSRLNRLRVKTPRYAHLEKFCQVFGEESVDFVEYDRANFARRNIVRDFAERIDVPVPETLINPVNSSASAPMLGMMLSLNQQFEDEDPRIVNMAKSSLAEHCDFPDAEKVALDPELVDEKVRDEDAAWAVARMGEDFLNEDVEGQLVASTADLIGQDPGWHDGIEAAIKESRKLPKVAALLEEFAAPRRPR